MLKSKVFTIVFTGNYVIEAMLIVRIICISIVIECLSSLKRSTSVGEVWKIRLPVSNLPGFEMPVEVLKIEDDDGVAHGQMAPIDFLHLSKFTLGNRDLEREVLELFTAHAPQYLDQMRAATGSSDWHEAVHTLKGSAAAVGAWHVAELAARAERLRYEFDQQSRACMIERLAVAVHEAANHIAKHYSSH